MLLCAGMAAQTAEPSQCFTYDDLMKIRSLNRTVAGLRFTNDGEHYTAIVGGDVCLYSVATGEAVDTLYDAAAMPDTVVVEDYVLSDDGRLMLVSTNHRRIYRRSSRRRTNLFSTSGRIPSGFAGVGLRTSRCITYRRYSASFFRVDTRTVRLATS